LLSYLVICQSQALSPLLTHLRFHLFITSGLDLQTTRLSKLFGLSYNIDCGMGYAAVERAVWGTTDRRENALLCAVTAERDTTAAMCTMD
jgi:hypothetical protein